MNASRTHMIEMNEAQMLRIADLLAADLAANPDDYTETESAPHNPLAYLEACFRDCIATTDANYSRDMLHGFTL